MTLPEQQEAARVEIDKQFARDFATDAVYSDKELIEIMSNILKANADWVYSFADTLIARTRQETLDAVKVGMPDKDDGIHPKTKMPQYKPFNKGTAVGWNGYRTAMLKHLKLLR